MQFPLAIQIEVFLPPGQSRAHMAMMFSQRIVFAVCPASASTAMMAGELRIPRYASRWRPNTLRFLMNRYRVIVIALS